MKKIIFVIFLIIASIFLFSEYKGENYIKKEIEKARYCDVDSDCILIESKCPFGCYAAINVYEKDKITMLINSYDPKFSKCVYGCILCESAICINNKCKEVCGS